MSFCSHNHSVILRHLLVILMIMMAMLERKTDAECAFQAIFNFGDSNSDTGGFFSAFPFQPSPNDMTYFRRPTARPTDGRLFIDFLAQALGLPFLSPYLQSIGSDYTHDANFATSSSTVLQPSTSLFVTGVGPFYLGVQLNQMKHFKARVDEQYSGQTNLPSSDIFGKALYTFYIGQNDLTSNLGGLGIDEEVYGLRGRTFLVLNLAPVGCYPMFLAQPPHESSGIDQSGCVVSYNNAVNDYNNMLNEALQQVGDDLPDANVIYMDNHAVLLDLFQNPSSNGMKHGTTACCGHGGGAYNYDPQVFCGYTNFIDGESVTATACSDPENYVSWDGIHITEAANKALVYAILSGSYFDPPFSFQQFCDIQPIG